MAALAELGPGPAFTPEQRERRFFLGMAIAITAFVLFGFGGYIVVGYSSFHAPWWAHVHAVSYTVWIGLYLTQNWLVVRGDLATHRKLGRFMGGLALWLVVVGTALLYLSMSAHRSPPPVFTAAMLIVMDELAILGFAALVMAGLANRHRSDWHRRLMLSATVCIIAPAFGRITVLTIGFSWPAIIAMQLAMIAVAMAFDWRTRGQIHPALWWGAGLIAGIGVASPLLAQAPAMIAFANTVAGG